MPIPLSSPVPSVAAPEPILDALRRAAAAIVAADPRHCVGEVIALRQLIEPIAPFQIDATQCIGDGRIALEQGLAISPAQAAFCLREPIRTAAFLKGLMLAIADRLAEARPSGRPLRVLYAGCGPYAALALPLMSLLREGEVVFDLLDVNAESLDSARGLVATLGLDGFVSSYVLADACAYRVPGDSVPDIIVSETLNTCLGNEPQVAIVRNLVPQCPEATLIPERIQVDACLATSGGHPERLAELGSIFALDKESVASWASIAGDRLPAATIRIQESDNAADDGRRQFRLATRIRVYRDTWLGDHDCSLTMPKKLRWLSKSVPPGDLKFEYRLGRKPGLSLHRPPEASPALQQYIQYANTRVLSPEEAAARSDLIDRIVAFLREIGLCVEFAKLPGKTFVPGISLGGGVIRIDRDRLAYPGDLLHEAGHLAVISAEQRAQAKPDIGKEPAEELMAIAWSWAALARLGIAPEVVFHEAGYKGGSRNIIENFSQGRYFGVPMLQYYGLAYEELLANERGVAPFPYMARWLRD